MVKKHDEWANKLAPKAVRVEGVSTVSEPALGWCAIDKTYGVAWWAKCDNCGEEHEDDNPHFVCRICQTRVRCLKCIGADVENGDESEHKCPLTVAGVAAPRDAGAAKAQGVGWLGPSCCQIDGVHQKPGTGQIYYTYTSLGSDGREELDSDDDLSLWREGKEKVMNMESFLPAEAGPAPSAASLASYKNEGIIAHVRENPELCEALKQAMSGQESIVSLD